MQELGIAGSQNRVVQNLGSQKQKLACKPHEGKATSPYAHAQHGVFLHGSCIQCRKDNPKFSSC